MKILITSGGTTEYIDNVRVMTNVSSGKLGATIARHLFEYPVGEDDFMVDELYYLHGKNAVMPFKASDIHEDQEDCFHPIEIKDTASLMEKMEELVPKVDVVIHAMAVSDFGFKRDKPVKLKSNDPKAFIKYLEENIVINPKVISHIKEWNPNVYLIGFKLEVGKTKEELMDIARSSMTRNNCDLVIANDLAEIKKWQKHIAHFVFKSFHYTVFHKQGIAEEIASVLEAREKKRPVNEETKSSDN